MKNKLIASILGAILPFSAVAAEGVVSVPSKYSVEKTADRFEDIIKKKGLTLFARIDHSDNASKVNLELDPTEVIIFGNPMVGTPLMQCSQQVAIDLPQKALIWQDENGKVWFSYNDPEYLMERHNMQGCEAVIKRVSTILNGLSKAATT